MTATTTTHAPLIIDVAGTELSDADRRRLANPLVGGVIHFARNWQDRAQMTALNAEIKAIRPDLLICVDHEGGRVQRFRTDGFTHLPSMRALGELWMRDAMRATQAATARARCWPPSCAPAASTSALRRCSTSTTAAAASSATAAFTATRAWWRCWPRA
jgi:beta-glucosidase-like glycosyl hydrolase